MGLFSRFCVGVTVDALRPGYKIVNASRHGEAIQRQPIMPQDVHARHEAGHDEGG
jgi:hypothetical protein